MAEYYQASDLVIQASLEEGLGLSPLEALACEVPILVSKVGGLVAHLEEYSNFFEAGNYLQLKNEIEKHIENPESLILKAKKGRIYVNKYWSQDVAYDSIKTMMKT